MGASNLSPLTQETNIQYGAIISTDHQYETIPSLTGDPLDMFFEAMEYSVSLWSPTMLYKALYGFGSKMYEYRDFDGARRAFAMAHHKAVETWRSQLLQEHVKRQLATNTTDLYHYLVHCCVMLEPNHLDTFEYAVFGKGRVFIDMLASGTFDLQGIKESQNFNDEWKEYLAFFDEIDKVLTKYDLKEHVKKEKIDAIKKTQANHLDKLAQKYPDLTTIPAVPALRTAQALKLADDLNATLVTFIEHAGGWSAFVINPEKDQNPQHVPLPLLKKGEYEPQRLTLELKKELSLKKTGVSLKKLYQAVIAPLQPFLPKSGQCKRLIFAPFGKLHLLPLHAAFNEDTEMYLEQEYVISFTPSLSALHVALTQAKQGRERRIRESKQPLLHMRLLNVAFPGSLTIKENYLFKAVETAKEMAKILKNVTPLYHDEATVEAIVRLAPNHEMINFFAHNEFKPSTPEDSGLVLCESNLTVKRIINQFNLQQTRLVTLVGCGTGQAQINQGEELVGLIQAFMIAKAKAVVAGLWEVDMTPTLTLFEHFYDQIYAGQSPAKALKQATQYIREKPGWEHPYYWAAFQASGLAYELDI